MADQVQLDEHASTPTEEALSPSRRGFLAGAAGLTGVALGVASWQPVLAAGPGGLTDGIAASTAGGGFAGTVGLVALELGGSSAGTVSSAQGGAAVATVVNEKLGADQIVHKHLAGVKYEDITLSCGAGMSKSFYQWIKESFSARGQKESGAIRAATVNLKEVFRIDFTQALITEVGFPALDAASKDAAKMTVKFAPETTRSAPGSGGSVTTIKTPTTLKWLSSNFKLTINGFDSTLARHITKVDTFTVKQTFTRNADGQQVGSSVEFGSLTFTLPDSQAAPLYKWFADFAIKGNSSVENQKTGSLSFLAPNLMTELFRIDLSGLGIYKLEPSGPLAPSTALPTVTATLFVNKATLASFPGSGQLK